MDPPGRKVKSALRSVLGALIGEYCAVCCRKTLFKESNAIGDELALQWELTPADRAYFDRREGGYCSRCCCSRRSGQFAAVLLRFANERCRTPLSCPLSDLCANPAFQRLRIAAINSIGRLHPFLSQLPNLSYSEYGSIDPEVPDENILRLSYADNIFDLVLCSETLEHIPDVDRALSEMYRILKPGGTLLCSVPILMNRTTRRRADITDGSLTHLLAPSYHGAQEQKRSDYLVFYEFGKDFQHHCERSGFDIETVQDTSNPTLIVFSGRKKDFGCPA